MTRQLRERRLRGAASPSEEPSSRQGAGTLRILLHEGPHFTLTLTHGGQLPVQPIEEEKTKWRDEVASVIGKLFPPGHLGTGLPLFRGDVRFCEIA